jgi:hypothetical protein
MIWVSCPEVYSERLCDVMTHEKTVLTESWRGFMGRIMAHNLYGWVASWVNGHKNHLLQREWISFDLRVYAVKPLWKLKKKINEIPWKTEYSQLIGKELLKGDYLLTVSQVETNHDRDVGFWRHKPVLGKPKMKGKCMIDVTNAASEWARKD